MSLLNQPSRILISGDDAEWTSNNEWGGQSFNLTLPEAVVGATGIDCARAVIPNTQYPIPDYQNKLYYGGNGVVNTLTLTNNRNFASVPDLVAQLNVDATTQSAPLSFAYDTTTARISTTFTGTQISVVVNNANKRISLRWTPPGGATPVYTVVSIAEGIYSSAEAFAEAVRVAVQAYANTIPALAQPTYNIFTNISGYYQLGLGITSTTTNLPPDGLLDIEYYGGGGLSPAQIVANKFLLGIPPSVFYAENWAFFYPASTPLPTVLEDSVAFNSTPYSLTPRIQWPTKFALNTRLGYSNLGQVSVEGVAIGTFMPNLIRSRVIYILCNASVNDSITTDGLRNVLAKVPVNSAFGGLTEYSPPDFNFCRIVQSSYQNVEVSLLDDNYQPYNLVTEEPLELELVFAYKEINNAA